MKYYLVLIGVCVSLLQAAKFENIAVDLVIGGLDKPVWMTVTPTAPDYLFIVEKEGRIVVFDKKRGELLAEPLLDVRDKITIKMNEQGLLCLAFCPDFATTGRYYVYLTNNEGDTEILRFVNKIVDGKWQAEVNQGELLLEIKQDFRNHNGGWMGFGPDGALYIATGDGGAGFDPKDRGLDLNSHLGKILRLDVSPQKGYSTKGNPFVGQKGVQPEIYAYGLRNPWRCAWDGDYFYIADVGQREWEEINRVSFSKLKGANFGWAIYEGLELNPKKKSQKIKGDWERPIYVYPHDNSEYGGLSINGGFVYRGPIASLQGQYFFSDWISARIWSFDATLDKVQTSDINHWDETFKYKGKKIRQLVSFAEDVEKNLYLISHNGEIYQIVENN